MKKKRNPWGGMESHLLEFFFEPISWPVPHCSSIEFHSIHTWEIGGGNGIWMFAFFSIKSYKIKIALGILSVHTAISKGRANILSKTNLSFRAGAGKYPHENKWNIFSFNFSFLRLFLAASLVNIFLVFLIKNKDWRNIIPLDRPLLTGVATRQGEFVKLGHRTGLLHFTFWECLIFNIPALPAMESPLMYFTSACWTCLGD